MSVFDVMDYTKLLSPWAQMFGVWLCLVAFHIAGVIDAILWSRKAADAYKYNEHIWLTASRVVLMFVAMIPIHPYLVACLLFIFPLIHNGAYYLGRKQIDGAYSGWKAEPSAGSTAKINFSWKMRATMGTVGIVAILIFFIFYKPY